MAFTEVLNAVVRVYYVLERLRSVGYTLNVCECNGGAGDSEGRSAEIGRVGQRRIAAIIHNIKAADTMVVIVVG